VSTPSKSASQRENPASSGSEVCREAVG